MSDTWLDDAKKVPKKIAAIDFEILIDAAQDSNVSKYINEICNY